MGDKNSMTEAERVHQKSLLAKKLFDAWRGSDDKFVEWWQLPPNAIERWLRVAEAAMRASR